MRGDRASGRDRRGQHLDLALLDTQVAFLANQAANYLATGEVPQRLGNSHPNIVPYRLRHTRRQHHLACGNDNLFVKFCEVAGARISRRTRGSRPREARENRATSPRCSRDIQGAHDARLGAGAGGGGCAQRPINDIKQVFGEAAGVARE